MMILAKLIDLYSFVVFGSVIISWIRLPPHNPIARILHQLTEPLLGPIRRVMPAMGNIDFSPMVLLLGLQVLKRLLFGL
jgi:YggT family protein